MRSKTIDQVYSCMDWKDAVFPPIYLYHVTPKSLLPKILKEGLKGFQECHLSKTDAIYQDLIHNDIIDKEIILEYRERYSEMEEIPESEIEEKRFKEFIVRCFGEESPLLIAREGVEYHLSVQLGAIFFFKQIPALRHHHHDLVVLRVRADKIPCRCIIEANQECSEAIFQIYYKDSNRAPIKEHVENYYNSLRPLDVKDNDYPTEILAFGEIPPESIEYLPIDLSDGKAIEKESRVNKEIISNF